MYFIIAIGVFIVISFVIIFFVDKEKEEKPINVSEGFYNLFVDNIHKVKLISSKNFKTKYHAYILDTHLGEIAIYESSRDYYALIAIKFKDSEKNKGSVIGKMPRDIFIKLKNEYAAYLLDQLKPIESNNNYIDQDLV